MKKFILPIIAGMLSLTSCEDYLEAKNIYNKDLNTFYCDPTNINQAVAGMYLAQYTPTNLADEGISANLVDDIVLGGGGPGAQISTGIDAFRIEAYGDLNAVWSNSYRGIFRANTLIEKVPEADLSSYFGTEEEMNRYKNQIMGEAYFMRGLYFLRLARWYGQVPMIISTSTPRNLPRASYTETFQQIISDFKVAIDYFPTENASSLDDQYGHANRWIAEGYIARAYLHYVGYMTNIENEPTEDIKLTKAAGGKTLTKQDIINYISDCKDNSGYALVSDQRELWPYSYVNQAAVDFGDPNGDNVLPWAKNEGLEWVGQSGFSAKEGVGTGNSETMFVISYAFGDWGGLNGQGCTNRTCMYLSPNSSSCIPFFKGHGLGPVNPAFYNDWSDDDPRKAGSVLVAGDKECGMENYQDPGVPQYTGLFQKKYSSLVINGLYNETNTVRGVFAFLYNNLPSNEQLWHAQDYILLRFADVLLMHSELTETADGINEVRTRSGLDPIGGYSLDKLKEERLYELAFEASRYYDLVRWGDIYNGNNYYEVPINVTNEKNPEVYTRPMDATKKGLFPLPVNEVEISDGVYQQNPGW